jgi:hypothetical protein
MDLIQCVGELLCGIYACDEVFLKDNLINCGPHPYTVLAFSSEITNTFGLKTLSYENLGVKLHLLFIKGSDYLSIFEKIAKNVKASELTNEVKTWLIEEKRVGKKVTRTLVIDDRDPGYLQETANNAVSEIRKFTATPAEKKVSAWNTVAKAASTTVIVPVAKAAPKPVVKSPLELFTEYIASLGFKVVNDELSDDIYDLMAGNHSSTMRLINAGVNTIFWTPNYCPMNGYCPRTGECDNISCSYHSPLEIIKRCDRNLSLSKNGKKNDFVERVKVFLAAQRFLFEKEITDQDLIKKIFETSAKYLDERHLSLLTPANAKAF